MCDSLSQTLCLVHLCSLTKSVVRDLHLQLLCQKQGMSGGNLGTTFCLQLFTHSSHLNMNDSQAGPAPHITASTPNLPHSSTQIAHHTDSDTNKHAPPACRPSLPVCELGEHHCRRHIGWCHLLDVSYRGVSASACNMSTSCLRVLLVVAALEP